MSGCRRGAGGGTRGRRLRVGGERGGSEVRREGGRTVMAGARRGGGRGCVGRWGVASGLSGNVFVERERAGKDAERG